MPHPTGPERLAPSPNVRGLYAILDAGAYPIERLVELAVSAEAAGARWIQLRAKQLSGREFGALAESCCEQMRAPERVLWINDRVAVASRLPVLGVHLGQDDLPPASARDLLPADRLIGRSTHSLEQVRQADTDAAVDVVAIGPIRATMSKRDAEPEVGWRGLELARGVTAKPLVAIGGLDTSSYREARRRGADLVAMISGLGDSDRLVSTCRGLTAIEDEL